MSNVEVLENRRQGHGKWRGELGNGKVGFFAQACQHGTPGRIRESGENAVETIGPIVNHKVNLRQAPGRVKR